MRRQSEQPSFPARSVKTLRRFAVSPCRRQSALNQETPAHRGVLNAALTEREAGAVEATRDSLDGAIPWASRSAALTRSVNANAAHSMREETSATSGEHHSVRHRIRRGVHARGSRHAFIDWRWF